MSGEAKKYGLYVGGLIVLGALIATFVGPCGGG